LYKEENVNDGKRCNILEISYIIHTVQSYGRASHLALHCLLIFQKCFWKPVSYPKPIPTHGYWV